MLLLHFLCAVITVDNEKVIFIDLFIAESTLFLCVKFHNVRFMCFQSMTF